ncbi:MAG: hypothetical protein Q4D03_02485 [Bacteroidales bacterium]|nr:hypothetical protein [Bacteroidales bacterium]
MKNVKSFFMLVVVASILCGCSQRENNVSVGMADTSLETGNEHSALQQWVEASKGSLFKADTLFADMSIDEITSVYQQLVDSIIMIDIESPQVEDYCSALVRLQAYLFIPISSPDRFQKEDYERFNSLYKEEYPKTFDVINALPGGGEKYSDIMNSAIAHRQSAYR